MVYRGGCDSRLDETAVATDDLRRSQRVGNEAGPDLGARGGLVERQRWDLEGFGELMVQRVHLRG
jgi:hypothetical protein